MTIAMDCSIGPKWKLVDQFNRVAVCEVGKQLLVGRDGCDVLLKSKSVEPHHAVVEFDEAIDCLRVTDLSTQNGTFVNEQRIPPASPTRLGAGDRIRFGYDSVVYHVEQIEVKSQSPKVRHPRWTSDLRCNSDEPPSVLSNGVPSGSPLPRRRRSVQEEVDNEDKADTEEVQGVGMENCEGPVDLIITNNNIPIKDLSANVEDGKESEEEKAQVEVLEKNQKKEEEGEEESKSGPARASEAFTIDFEALPSSPAVPQGKPADTRGQHDSVPESVKVQDPLSSLLPDRLRKSLREREEKAKGAKERERINGGVKPTAAPALTDSRRRSSSYTRPVQRTNSSTRPRQRSTSKGRQSSIDRNSEDSHRMGMPGRVSAPRTSTAAHTVETRKSRYDGPGSSVRKNSVSDKSRTTSANVSIKAYSDGKTYLLEKMLTSPGQAGRGRGGDSLKKVKSSDNGLRAIHPQDIKGDSDSGERVVDAECESAPSETGTYTIENEKGAASKSKENLSEPSVPNTDTSGPLHDTQEALDALEKRINQSNSRDDLDSEMQTIDTKRRPSIHQQQQQNGGLLYNVLCPARPSRRTPSDHGSDHAAPKRDGSAVRRSNSENQKTSRSFQTRRNSAMQSSQDQESGRPRTSSTTATSAARRRMSTGNSSEAAGAAAISGRESASSSRKGSNPSIHSSTKSSNNISRFDYGRHSLKSQSQSSATTQRSPRQQQQKLLQQQADKKAEALEALNRRKGYNPRKAALEGRTPRKNNTSEGEGQASPNERPRRTSSADTRPMTEMDSQRGHPSHSTAASRRVPSLRRHESLNSGKGPTRATHRMSGVIPNTGSLLAPRLAASAFLDVRSPCSQRSQSVSNAETSCSEVAYDLLLVSSIHVMTSKLRRGFDDLLKKLRENRVLTRTPTPIDELFQSKPPAHLNSTNAELKEALADLRLIECGLQTLESHLVPSANEGAVSARTTTLGGCTESEYQQELKRITTGMMGFRPILDNDSDNDHSNVEPHTVESAEAPADSEPFRPVVQRPLPRLESSF